MLREELLKKYANGQRNTSTDFKGAKNLTPEQVRVAYNWDSAKYDQEIFEKLGLPLNTNNDDDIC